MAQETVEESLGSMKGVPQRLKPRAFVVARGTRSAPLRAGSEAVPSSKTFFTGPSEECF
jgi:hypothetical protein